VGVDDPSPGSVHEAAEEAEASSRLVVDPTDVIDLTEEDSPETELLEKLAEFKVEWGASVVAADERGAPGAGSIRG